jgi:predicted transcriptional regulator
MEDNKDRTDNKDQTSENNVETQPEVEEEIEEETEKTSKRETQNLLKDLKIITAILLGKKRNKELAKVLDTDKSFTSKKIKELEEKGLVSKQGEGRKVQYEVNESRALGFLQRKVVLKWSKKTQKEEKQKEEEKNGERSEI